MLRSGFRFLLRRTTSWKHYYFYFSQVILKNCIFSITWALVTSHIITKINQLFKIHLDENLIMIIRLSHADWSCDMTKLWWRIYEKVHPDSSCSYWLDSNILHPRHNMYECIYRAENLNLRHPFFRYPEGDYLYYLYFK